MGVGLKRFDVVLVETEPPVGHEMRKTRPCLVVSPDEMNEVLPTLIVAPMTTVRRAYPTRVDCSFQQTRGQVALDQIRVIDATRVIKQLGRLRGKSNERVLAVLGEMFAP